MITKLQSSKRWQEWHLIILNPAVMEKFQKLGKNSESENAGDALYEKKHM
jgi:hypothetical protein